MSCDFLTVSRFIGSLDCGIVTKISLYNMLAISKLSYVAAFLPPNRDILKVEKRALQLLLRGPWNAIPDGVVKNLKCLGLPVEARDLSIMSSASRIRVAASTSNAVKDLHSKCDRLMRKSDCVILRHLDDHFLHQSCLHHVVFQHSRFEQEFPQFVGQKVSQKVAYQCLSGKRIPYDFKRLVSARLARYFPLESFESCIPSALGHYKSSHATLGFAPLSDNLQSLVHLLSLWQKGPSVLLWVRFPLRLGLSYSCLS